MCLKVTKQQVFRGKVAYKVFSTRKISHGKHKGKFAIKSPFQAHKPITKKYTANSGYCSDYVHGYIRSGYIHAYRTFSQARNMMDANDCIIKIRLYGEGYYGTLMEICAKTVKLEQVLYRTDNFFKVMAKSTHRQVILPKD